MAKKGKYIPIAGEHHVVRRCPYQRIIHEKGTGKPIGIFPTAMALRPEMNEDYLSVNYLEFFNGKKIDQLKAIVAAHRAKAKRGPLHPESAVAVLNSGKIQEIGLINSCKLRVLHTHSPHDPSYSRVTGLPLNNANDDLLSDLADEASKDFMLLRDVDAA